jgi:hypothetical protein
LNIVLDKSLIVDNITVAISPYGGGAQFIAAGVAVALPLIGKMGSTHGVLRKSDDGALIRVDSGNSWHQEKPVAVVRGIGAGLGDFMDRPLST